MILNQHVTQILQGIDPICTPYIRKDGTLLVKLNKALYGLKQSGALWNETLDTFLIALGFKVNLCDPCVYNKLRNATRLTVAVHVDAHLTRDKDMRLYWFAEEIRKQFGHVTEQQGDKLDYVGIEITRIPNGSLYMRMRKIIQEIVTKADGEASTPAAQSLFQKLGDQTPLTKADKALFIPESLS